VISGRAGFKVVTRHLLRTVRGEFRDQIIRDYVLTYARGQFETSVLAKVKVYGAGGCAAGGDAFREAACAGAAFLAQHAFDYFQEDQAFTDAVTWQVQSVPDAAAEALLIIAWGIGFADMVTGAGAAALPIPDAAATLSALRSLCRV
jgi:hypothetical protein